MTETHFIARQPLLDAKERIIGYRLTAQAQEGTSAANDGLADFMASTVKSNEDIWKAGGLRLYLDVSVKELAERGGDGLDPQSTVFVVSAADLDDSVAIETLRTLRGAGFGICARYQDLAGRDKETVSLISIVEVDLRSLDLAVLPKLAASLKQASLEMVCSHVSSWNQFNACAALGAPALAEEFQLTLRPEVTTKGLNPTQTVIMQLMQLARKNADVRQIEEMLRRDPAVSYKLLRYINSPGFGLSVEVQSLRHAVTMLGYSPLYRWLSLLLATASNNGQSPALMRTAILRGRLAELLAQGLLPKTEAENLFVAGMFSLLDRLLGVSMQEVLETVQLSDSISEALLTRGGMYGPFLTLAESCESGHGRISDAADALFLSSHQVNDAHLAALAWSQTLQL